MAESSFFDEGGVSVSNARFIVHDQTFAMSGVTSVKTSKKEPSRKGSYILAGIGFLALLVGGKLALVGWLLILSAGGLWYFQRTEFSVWLSTASGEAKALTSKDSETIAKIVAALNEAIVHRG
jgi:Family of unknown function (DUF6232)